MDLDRIEGLVGNVMPSYALLQETLDRLRKEEARDVRDLRLVPEFEVKYFEDIRNTRRPLESRVSPNRVMRDLLGEPHALANESPSWQQGKMVFAVKQAEESLAKAWEEFNWKRQKNTNVHNFGGFTVECGGANCTISGCVQAARARIRELAKEAAVPKAHPIATNVEFMMGKGSTGLFATPVSTMISWSTGYEDPLKAAKLPRLTVEMQKLLEETGGYTHWLSWQETQHFALNSRETDLPDEEDDESGGPWEMNLVEEETLRTTVIDRLDDARLMQREVKAFWKSWTPGTALCGFSTQATVSDAFGRLMDIQTVMDSAEFVMDVRRRAPRVNHKFNLFIKRADSWNPIKKTTCEREYRKDQGGLVFWNEHQGFWSDPLDDGFIVKRLTKALKRWAWKSDGEFPRFSLGAHPTDVAPEVENIHFRCKFDAFQKGIDLKRMWCNTCSRRATEREDYADHFGKKRDVIVKVLDEVDEDGNSKVIVKNMFVRDVFDATRTQRLFAGPWFNLAWDIEGRTGDWRCLGCGMSKATRKLMVHYKFRSRTGTVWSVSAELSGENMIDTLMSNRGIR